MGVTPKKPKFKGTFVNQVSKTYGTKPGTAFGNGRSTRHWRWNGVDWVKISKKQYDNIITSDNYGKPSPGEIDATVDPLSIRFPADIATGGDSSYVLFSFYKYKPPFQDKTGAQGGLTVKKKNGSTKTVFKNNEYVNQDLNSYNKGGVLTEEFEQVDGLRQIMLYMPDDIQDAYKADWEGKAFGSITAGLLAAAGRDGVGYKLKSALQTAKKTAANLPVNAAAGIITNLAKGITGDQINASDVFGGISGVVKNPNVELLFQKMNLRTFDLTFKMSPYDSEETQNIQKICQTFKKAMLPSYDLGDRKVFGMDKNENVASQNKDPALNSSFIAVPSVCHVQFMHGGSRNTYVPKYKMCAITDVNVNYTPDGNYAVFQGGAPVATELKISFMETKLVFAEDIDMGDETPLDLSVTAPSGQQYGPMASDVRLKENIIKVGNSPSGINIYEWNYIGNKQRYRGVMAQEILEKHPEAVALQPDGYMSVYYGKIDVNMERVK